MFTREEQQALLQAARHAIEREFGKAPAVPPCSPTEHLSQPAGAFVTLRRGEELRGCIGFIEAADSILSVVEEAAQKAAFEDYRFPRVVQEECADLSIEISVLSPLKQITRVEEIEVGRHGLLLELRHARGLLLPQVAKEYGWGSREFLEHTALKAGLPGTAWKDPACRIFVFEAEIFGEASVAARHDDGE